MNIHEAQIENYRTLRPYLDPPGRTSVDELIERAHVRASFSRPNELPRINW